jgi:PAS domain S-box-containing protein
MDQEFNLLYSRISILKKEEELREKTRYIDSLVNNFHNLEEIYFSKDFVNNKIMAVSSSFEKIYGVPDTKLFENPDYWFERIHPDDISKIKKGFEKLFKGNFLTEEYRIIREDGKVRWLYSRTIPVLDNLGNLIRIDRIATDITHRKNFEILLSNIDKKQ